ncbi:hypothetical protein OFY17_10660 [Marinomonas sp. C2222]|uniref:Uncharacterized protein n=1 Tax=Marinomonas sargassi TaxID=2984494 RepID=A0ABT2YTX0_9GAMM|nr:hypothetical protein [Marinomonas sargassi]MCV2403342.1 hypothetical protein [Marinomonas sargassi]
MKNSIFSTEALGDFTTANPTSEVEYYVALANKQRAEMVASMASSIAKKVKASFANIKKSLSQQSMKHA